MESKIIILAVMIISITGTKGIPNLYGGFEQFTEKLAVRLANRGHELTIYNPSFHPSTDYPVSKVNIIRKFSPEKLMGAAANYIYDFLSIRDAIRNQAEIILECGYASAAPGYRLLNFQKTKIVTHLDGFEWQRSKWSGNVQKIIRKSERTAVRLSHRLVCDHQLIRQYFIDSYGADPVYIPYGANDSVKPDKQLLDSHQLTPNEYYLVISRLEPENNIQTIIEGYLRSGKSTKLLIVGNSRNNYSHGLKSKYQSTKQVIFHKGIYNEDLLNALRHFSKAYFHGHSVGGTNPSLLEAMAAGATIIGHDNPFIRNILNDNALYFSSSDDITYLLASENEWINKKQEWAANNIRLISEKYQWDQITDQYEDLFRKVLEEKILK